jgi:hypothetical protein
VSRRPFCSEISADSGEPLAGTASRVDHWLLVEYRGVWSSDALAGSGLSDQVKAALRALVNALRPAKVLFIRRRERRDRGGLAVFFARSLAGRECLTRLEVDAYGDLVDIDFAAPEPPGAAVDHPILLVCTHGKHDPCCARYGRPLYDVLADQAEAEWVWQVTHIGGDRFAGNVVILPEGLYYGRVRVEEAWTLLDEHLGGRVFLDRFRGRSTQPFAVQAGEIELRRRLGLAGIADVIVTRAARRSGTWSAELRETRSGRVHKLEIDVEEGPLTYLTCAADALRHPPRFVVRRRLGSADQGGSADTAGPSTPPPG